MIRNLAIKQEAELGPADDLAALGEIADQIAAANIFQDYRERKAPNTIRRQDAGLSLFVKYLAEMGVEVGDLANDPQAWQGISWGLVAGFLRWQLMKGYAVSSANVRLSTVKVYARLAFKSGVLSADQYALIRAVEGYSRKEANRIDEQREEAGIETRIGEKKPQAVSLTPDQARALKEQPNTPQGRRDRLLMCLFLDHGLRVGEVARLTVSDFDLPAGELRFERPKVDKIQTHRLSADTLRAALAYFELDALPIGPLLRGSKRGGQLEGEMSERALTKRVAYLGRRIGVEGLSAHDCRHYWATQAARHNTPIDRLMDAGGWASPDMPLRYVEAAKIANEGVNLG